MQYILSHFNVVLEKLAEHMTLSLVASLLAALIGVPLGIFIAKRKILKKPVITAVNIIYTTPSMALFTFLIPFMGIGSKPATISLMLYCLMNIVINTAAGIEGVDRSIIEAATGMGMTKMELLFKVELPLGLPLIMAGIRLSIVMSINIATVASYIGAGGLGDLVLSGIFSMNVDKILAGAIPICLLAFVTDHLLALLEKRLSRWSQSETAVKPAKA